VHVPQGMAEAEVLSVIEQVIPVAVSKISVPGLDREDLLQEARIMALEALERYDPQPGADGRPTRPLERFLFVHVRNRTLNLRRSRFVRADPPCVQCHHAQPCREDGQVCEAYARWKSIQDRKLKVRCPQAIDRVDDEHEKNTRYASDVVENAELKEMLAKIDQHLDIELRATYLQMRAGKGNIPKAKRQAVEAAVREILGNVDLAA